MLLELIAPLLLCTPFPGAGPLVTRPNVRWIVLGEMHGTAETPAAIVDMACAASLAGRKVTVAIEQTPANQPALDAYLASDGGAQARSALLAAPMWRVKDGRSSGAILAMIEQVRILSRAGMVSRIAAIDAREWRGSAALRDADMGANLSAVDPGAGGIVIVLIGNVHAQKGMVGFGTDLHKAATAYLPPEAVLSLRVNDNGGMAWVCMQSCGENRIGTPRDAARGILLQPPADGAYDGVLELGVPTTASFPAAE